MRPPNTPASPISRSQFRPRCRRNRPRAIWPPRLRFFFFGYQGRTSTTCTWPASPTIAPTPSSGQRRAPREHAQKRTTGTDWTDGYHRIRTRDTKSHDQVYFNNMDEPVMETVDTNSTAALVSAPDDTGHFDNGARRHRRLHTPWVADASTQRCLSARYNGAVKRSHLCRTPGSARARGAPAACPLRFQKVLPPPPGPPQANIIAANSSPPRTARALLRCQSSRGVSTFPASANGSSPLHLSHGARGPAATLTGQTPNKTARDTVCSGQRQQEEWCQTYSPSRKW